MTKPLFHYQMLFAIKYAVKSINRRKSKNLAAVLAVALGVTLLTGVNAGSNGMGKALASTWWNAIQDTDVDVIDPINEYFPQNMTDKIGESTDPRLEGLEVISPKISYFSIPIYADGNFRKDVNIRGILPGEGRVPFYDLAGEVVDLSSHLQLGSNAAIVSKEMATLMDIQVGDTIHSTLPDGNGTNIPAQYEVSIIYDDSTGRGRAGYFRIVPQMYVHLAYLQNALIPQLQDHINNIELVFESTEEGGSINKDLGGLDINGKSFQGKEKLEFAVDGVEEVLIDTMPDVYVWSERVVAANNIKAEISGIKSVLNIFVFLLNATALLLIINVQSMGLEDRRNQTAILRAMGASRVSVLRVFMYESAVVGVIGSSFGLVLGYFYGEFIQYQILTIFELEPGSSSLDQAAITQAFIFGIAISVLTAVLPAYRSSGMNITSELRGIPQPEEQKKGHKTIFFGALFTIFGLSFAQNVGNFWTKEAWSTFENHVNIMLGLGLTIAGIGLLLTLAIPRRLALNISGFAIWGFAVFTMFVTVDWVKDGDGDYWFTVVLLYLVIGSSMLIIVNFEQIMRGLNKVLFAFSSARGIAQVTTNQLIGKKSRATLVFTIFTIILVLNIFLSSAANTMRTNYVDQYEWRSYGIDVVVDAEVPSNEISPMISDIKGVDHVFGFRSTWMPIYTAHPDWDGFSAIDHTFWQKVVEVPENVLNPNDNWNR
ncbi:MAG: ABC transporter permease [Candidatus Kariarchaeaceae archaeon]|jgi:ABC-type lipoprotein release transport system permease subunit